MARSCGATTDSYQPLRRRHRRHRRPPHPPRPARLSKRALRLASTRRLTSPAPTAWCGTCTRGVATPRCRSRSEGATHAQRAMRGTRPPFARRCSACRRASAASARPPCRSFTGGASSPGLVGAITRPPAATTASPRTYGSSPSWVGKLASRSVRRPTMRRTTATLVSGWGRMRAPTGTQAKPLATPTTAAARRPHRSRAGSSPRERWARPSTPSIWPARVRTRTARGRTSDAVGAFTRPPSIAPTSG